MKIISDFFNKFEKLGKLFRWGLLGSNQWVFFHTIGGGILTFGFLAGFWWYLFSVLISILSFGNIWIYPNFKFLMTPMYAFSQTLVITILWEFYENYKQTPTDKKKKEIYRTIEIFWYDQIGDVIAANWCSLLVILGYMIGMRAS